MHKIDAPGATIDNLFTEGNPSLGVPATEVSDDWLNDVQEELVTVIENAGLTLSKGTQDQLYDAIIALIGGGGANIKLDPLANNTADQVITGLVIDKASFKGAIIFYDVHRETDSSNVQESGILVANHDPKDDVWRLEKLISGLDDSGSTFNIVSGTGQVRVTTDDLAGTSYDGQLRVTGVMRFAQ